MVNKNSIVSCFLLLHLINNFSFIEQNIHIRLNFKSLTIFHITMILIELTKMGR